MYISDRILFALKQFNADYLFCFGDKLFKGQLLKEYKNRMVNFHPSVLPAFPGLKAIDKALENNSFLLGNTAHFIDEGIDSGPVIMQSILSAVNFRDYFDVLDMQIPMLLQIVQWLNSNRISVVENKVNIKDATYEVTSYIPNLEINL